MKRMLGLFFLMSVTASAGSRAPTGGTLQVVIVSPEAADSPTDTFRLLLTHQPLCRIASMSRPSPNVLRLASVDPALVTASLERAREAPVARGFMVPVASWATVDAHTVELQLKGAAPDLERMLCHPGFAVPLGAFQGKGNRLEAFAEQPSGRPHLDAIVLETADGRTAERLFAQRRAQLIVGAATADDAPQLFATAIVLGPNLSELKNVFESTLDRGNLARFFVPGPAGPLPGLLPPSLGPQVPSAMPSKPVPLIPPREVALLFDADAAHEKSIAQRLQVKLQPLGYRLALKPTARAQLLVRNLTANEVALRSVLLPPSPTGALVVWLEVVGQHGRVSGFLRQIGVGEPAVLDARAREAALTLGAELPLIPLVTRGLGVTAAKEVQHLTRDELGLPRLDDIFLSAE